MSGVTTKQGTGFFLKIRVTDLPVLSRFSTIFLVRGTRFWKMCCIAEGNELIKAVTTKEDTRFFFKNPWNGFYLSFTQPAFSTTLLVRGTYF